MSRWKAVVSVSLILGLLPVAPARGGDSASDPGLLPLIPDDAVIVIERPGHDAVHGAFAASNLGKLAANPLIARFARDTRVKIEEQITESLFDLDKSSDPQFAKYLEMVHTVLVTLAYKPAAMFVMSSDKSGDDDPAIGILCLTGERRGECYQALKQLMAVGVPPLAGPGKRQSFTYDSGASRWQGIAMSDRAFSLTANPDERNRMLRDWNDGIILVCWTGELLAIASSLHAADAISRVLSAEGKSIQGHKDMQAVLAKTAMADWAFRWYVDIDRLRKLGLRGRPAPPELVAMGGDTILGIGGTEGYADQVYTTRTYMHAPDADRGFPRLLSPGADHATGLSMVPRNSSIALAGQINMDVLLRMIRDVTGGEQAQAVTTQPAAAPGAEEAVQAKPTEADEPDMIEQIAKVLATSDGHGGIYMTNIEMAAMGMLGARKFEVPIGFVLQTRDPEQAAAAIRALTEPVGDEGDTDDDDGDAPPAVATPSKVYRGVTFEALDTRGGPDLRMAVLDDRLILGFNDMAVIAGIDAAKDGRGGISAKGRGKDLLALAGDGAAAFKLNLPALAATVGQIMPRRMMMMMNEPDSPLATLPPAAILGHLLNQEVAVIRSDGTGLLMESRGMLPMASKVGVLAPWSGIVFYWFIMH